MNKEKFDQLFLGVIDMIYSLGIRLFHNDAHYVQDFVQDIYIHALKKRNMFHGKSKFSTWIYRLAMNQGLNKIKKMKSFKEDLVESTVEYENVEFDEPILQRIIENEQTVIVQKAIEKLPVVQNLVLILYYYEHFSYQQISAKLDMQQGTVKSHLHRAKKHLAHLIKNS